MDSKVVQRLVLCRSFTMRPCEHQIKIDFGAALFCVTQSSYRVGARFKRCVDARKSDVMSKNSKNDLV